VAMSRALTAPTTRADVLSADDTELMVEQLPLCLVNSSTGAPTRVVHTFSWLWDWVDMNDVADTSQTTSLAPTEQYASTYFSAPLVGARLLQVALRIALRSSQTLWFCCRHSQRRYQASKVISRE
jgi:hypothetical protein